MGAGGGIIVAVLGSERAFYRDRRGDGGSVEFVELPDSKAASGCAEDKGNGGDRPEGGLRSLFPLISSLRLLRYH